MRRYNMSGLFHYSEQIHGQLPEQTEAGAYYKLLEEVWQIFYRLHLRA